MMTSPAFEPVELPSRYAKAFVAILAAVLAVLVTALTDNIVTLAETIGIGVALVTAVGVYLVPNLDTGPGRYLKLIVAVIGTALQAAGPLVLNDGAFPPSAWLLVLLAALGAISVGITPNAPPMADRVVISDSAGLVVPRELTQAEAAALRDRFLRRSGRPAGDPNVL
jgi:hypothetical protein